MGYDSFECLQCYEYGINKICDDDSRYETCLKCVHEICKSTNDRVVGILKDQFDWNCRGKCSLCNTSGITIEITLCNNHSKITQFHNDDPNIKYGCYLCDYEGKSHYEGTRLTDINYCNKCKDNLIQNYLIRTKGIPTFDDSDEYEDVCDKCQIFCTLKMLPLCSYHYNEVNSV